VKTALGVADEPEHDRRAERRARRR
jgi:hypothetical protein